MNPGIGRSIAEGFSAANRSWLGMGIVAGCWLAVGLIGLVSLFLSNPPAALFQQESASVAERAALLTQPTPPASEPEETDLFNQLQTTEQPAAPSAPEALPPTPAAPEAPEGSQERQRAIGDWMGRSWPILLLLAILFIVVGTWLQGGQIGYLAEQIRARHSDVPAFWKVGARAFWALLGASALGLLAVVGFLLLIGLIAAGLSFLVTNAPTWVSSAIAFFLILATVVSFAWVGIRACLWFVAIATDGLGPIGGLSASFRATKGKWWKTFWLTVVLGLIALGVSLPLFLLEAFSGAIGGAGALIAILVAVGNIVVRLYLGFFFLAAYIRFYEDAKPAAAAAAPVPLTRPV